MSYSRVGLHVSYLSAPEGVSLGLLRNIGCLHLKETTTAKRSATIDRAYPSQARFAFGIWPESLCLGRICLMQFTVYLGKFKARQFKDS